MTDAVLTINAGSSSLKFSLYRVDGQAPALALEGQIEGIGTAPRMKAKDAEGQELADRRWQDAGMDHAAFFRVLGEWLRGQLGDTRLAGVGHRVVHGGIDFAAPVRIDAAVLGGLEKLCPLAPLHQPHNLAGIRAVAAAQPDLPQVACFDTAFHRAHPELADWFALPRRFHDDGIRRYGFHGLSYEYIARTLPTVAPELADARVVVAHLGSGASMCAMRAGRSVDSTMGFTALDGLPMGTRCGALDPGVVLHLIRAYGMDADAIEAMLYHDCGLKGVSGISNDMRDLLGERRSARRAGGRAFRLAYRPRAWRARCSARRPGCPGVHRRDRRALARDPAKVCARAGWLGIALDEAANRAGGPRISTAASQVAVFAIPTDEEQMIARHTLAVLNGAWTGWRA